MDPDKYDEQKKSSVVIIAQAAHENRIPFQSRGSEQHHRVLQQAIRNILSTDLAKFPYAKILDGPPTADVAWDRRLPCIFRNYPIEENENLCHGAMTKAQEYYDTWDPDILMFYAKAVKDFHHAQSGTKAFNVRLVELVAAALHQIGVILYQLDFRLHEGDIHSVINWKFPTEGTRLADIIPQPTISLSPCLFKLGYISWGQVSVHLARGNRRIDAPNHR